MASDGTAFRVFSDPNSDLCFLKSASCRRPPCQPLESEHACASPLPWRGKVAKTTLAQCQPRLSSSVTRDRPPRSRHHEPTQAWVRRGTRRERGRGEKPLPCWQQFGERKVRSGTSDAPVDHEPLSCCRQHAPGQLGGGYCTGLRASKRASSLHTVLCSYAAHSPVGTSVAAVTKTGWTPKAAD